MIALIIGCSIITSCLYRAGGMGKDQKYWIPVWMRHSWVRDWLCPLFILLPLFMQHPSWLFLPVYGMIGAAFTTYWDWLFKKDNFWVSGLVVGLAQLPLVLAGFAWWEITLRALFITVSWGLLCKLYKNDHLEEHGRGFLASISNLI
jgi:hypothetical protein